MLMPPAEMSIRWPRSSGSKSVGHAGFRRATTGIDCAADCSQPFEEGSSVSLAATAASGSSFTGWSGGACTGTGACTLVVSGGTNVSATFTLLQHELSIAVAGDGAGTVESAPAGISCGSECAHVYDHGTSITLNATPASGSVFSGWSGACTGTGSCTVALTAAVAHDRMAQLSPVVADARRPVLTPRERDCLALVAEGLSDGDIGERLGIAQLTAHAHVENAKRKLGAKTRAQAVARLYSLGLL